MKTILVLTGLLLSIFFTSTAQVPGSILAITPDCCQQTLEYKAKLEVTQLRINSLNELLEDTRLTGDALLKQKETRIQVLLSTSNTKLTQSNTREVKLDTKLNILQKRLEDELVNKRFLGWGRVRWVHQTLKLMQD